MHSSPLSQVPYRCKALYQSRSTSHCMHSFPLSQVPYRCKALYQSLINIYLPFNYQVQLKTRLIRSDVDISCRCEYIHISYEKKILQFNV